MANCLFKCNYVSKKKHNILKKQNNFNNKFNLSEKPIKINNNNLLMLLIN